MTPVAPPEPTIHPWHRQRVMETVRAVVAESLGLDNMPFKEGLLWHSSPGVILTYIGYKRASRAQGW